MDQHTHSPHPGAGAPSPAEVKKRYFEFFPVGTHREVLVLGDLVEQMPHWVGSLGHKVLCGARAGKCELCDQAGDSAHVDARQAEYIAPTYVRPWREREF